MPTPTAQHTWPLREVGMIVVVVLERTIVRLSSFQLHRQKGGFRRH